MQRGARNYATGKEEKKGGKKKQQQHKACRVLCGLQQRSGEEESVGGGVGVENNYVCIYSVSTVLNKLFSERLIFIVVLTFEDWTWGHSPYRFLFTLGRF